MAGPGRLFCRILDHGHLQQPCSPPLFREADPEEYLLRSLRIVEKEPAVLNNVFVAALFLSRKDLHQCVNILLEEWKGQERLLNRTCNAALALITGTESPLSRQEWADWWKVHAGQVPAKRERI